MLEASTSRASEPEAQNARTVRLVIGYARANESFLQELLRHLRAQPWPVPVDFWYDRELRAGEAWSEDIQRHFERAHVIVLLTSDDLFTSQYVMKYEIPLALARFVRGHASVVPVQLMPSDYWAVSPLSQLQTATGDGRPVSQWADRDAAWAQVVAQLAPTIAHASQRLRPMPRISRWLWAGLLVMAAGTVPFLGLRLHTSEVEPALATELAPLVQEVIRTTDDLANGSTYYLQRAPSDYRGLQNEVDDLRTIVIPFNHGCRRFRERRVQFRNLHQELAPRDPDLAVLVNDLFEYTDEHCQDEVLPSASAELALDLQHYALTSYWRRFTTRVEGSMRQMRKQLDAVERALLERVARRPPRCESAL